MASFSCSLENITNEFNSWDSILLRCGESYFSENEVDEELYIKTREMLGKILELFIISYKPKEQWSKFSTRPFPFGNNVIVASNKIGIEIEFGISFSDIANGQSFYLQSSITNPCNIRKMGDDFWGKFISLPSFGDFNFNENSFPNSEEHKKSARLFSNKNSNLFRFIRNFILLTMHKPDDIDNIGFLEMKWDIDTSWEYLLKHAYSTFCVFYDLNNMLYKSSKAR